MANTIQIKRSSTAGSAPSAGSLAQGELAVNLPDRKLYTKDASNAVVHLNPVLDGFRNRIINGDMRIDQRNAGASVTPTAATYTLDRWNSQVAVSSTFSIGRSNASLPTGFTRTLLVTSLAATSVGSTASNTIEQYVEGFNSADFGWGAAGAQSVTLSFWVRSSLTGTFGGCLQNADNTRSYVFSYSISAANTWEYKTVTIAGDTSGTWNTENGIGIKLRFSLGNGSTRQGSAGSWSGSDLRTVTGETQLLATNGATFYITGVQLEAGSVATPFERRPYGTELALCQRYYEKSYNIDVVPGTNSLPGALFCSGSTNQYNDFTFSHAFNVQKRAAPSIVFYQVTTGTVGTWNSERSGSIGTGTPVAYAVGMSKIGGYVSLGAAFVSASVYGHWTASAEL